MTAASGPCENCGTLLQGPYCHSCGARPRSARDLSLRHFAERAVSEFTDVEHSKLYRTLRALLLKPGLLSQEYFTARRIRYLRPLSLVLVIFALHIFVYSLSDDVALFNVDAAQRASSNPEAEKAFGLLDRAAEVRGIPVAELKENVNEKWSRYFSFSQIPQVLAFTLLLKLIFLFSRRHFVEHLVFALHFYAFQVLTVMLMWPIYYVVGIRMTAANFAIAIGKFLVDTAYIYFAARRFYGDRSVKAVLRAILIFLAYTAVYMGSYAIAFSTAMFSEFPPAKAMAKKDPPPKDVASLRKWQPGR